MKWIVIVVILSIGFFCTYKQVEDNNTSKAIYCFLATILTGLATSFIYDAIKAVDTGSMPTLPIETTQKEDEQYTERNPSTLYEELSSCETIMEETSGSKADSTQEAQLISETMAETTTAPVTTEALTEPPKIPVISDVTNISSFEGQLQDKGQVDQYKYTAPVSGTYRFDTDLSSGGEVRVRISGENGRSIDYSTNGLTIDLEAGKSYILSIEYTNGPCGYRVSIGVPMEVRDITGNSTVTGRIAYRNQKDRYLYTAPVSGTYRFDIGLDAAAKVKVRISGENGNTIDYGTNALSIDLEAEKTYILSIEYSNGPCDYEILLGVPQTVQDITENVSVSGNMLYQNQKDRYTYTAPTSGTYRFDTILSSGGEVRVRISGQNGKSINYNTNGLTIDLTSGETYILTVEYRNAPCEYTLNIGVPMEPEEITEYDTIIGSIAYRDQKDRYLYMAPYTGTYRFDTEVSTEADVRVRISGENGKSLNYNTNKLTINLEEGKLYILSIEYKNGFGDYEVYIEEP